MRCALALSFAILLAARALAADTVRVEAARLRFTVPTTWTRLPAAETEAARYRLPAHHWYFRSDSSKPFIHADRIPLKIAGGREADFRAYTFKQRLDPGDWRVNVEAEDGLIVGRVSVKVEDRDERPPSLTTISTRQVP